VKARLVVFGGGKMGEALVRGVLRAGWARPRDIAVVEPIDARRDALTVAHPGLHAVVDAPSGAEGAIVAVKPADVADACAAAVKAAPQRVVSIAAGVTLAQLEDWLTPPPVSTPDRTTWPGRRKCSDRSVWSCASPRRPWTR